MASRPPGVADASPVARALPQIGAVLQIATPLLPGIGIGEPIGSRSDAVGTLVTPAGWAFSIWGALYAGSLAFAIYQALPRTRSSDLLAPLRLPAAGAFLGNALWALYTQSYGLSAVSVAIILVTLVSMLRCYRAFSLWPLPFTAGERWCAVLPLSALASWLTVATTVNIAAALRFHGIEDGEATPLIAGAVVAAAGLIGATALAAGRGNPPYAMVFLWALAAIYAAGGQRAEEVAIAAGLAVVLIVAGAALGLSRGGARHWFRTIR